MALQAEDDAVTALGRVWREIDAFERKHNTNRLLPDAPRFIDYAWSRFDPKRVMEILLSEHPTYEALKPILFSGLCTWAVCPAKNSLRQHGMLLVALEHMREAEALGRATFANRDLPNSDLLGDIMGRLRALGHDFYSDFYYPVGGLAQILRSTTPGTFNRSLAKHTKHLSVAVAMMQIYDVNVKSADGTTEKYKSSEAKGFELVREIFGVNRGTTPIDIGTIETAWKASSLTSAMIYAAFTISLSEGQNLLNAVCSGESSYKRHGHLLPTWIKRARYAADTILVYSYKPQIGVANGSFLPEMDPERTPDPKLTTSELKRIKSEFDQTEILGAREKGQRRKRLSRRGPRTA